MASTHTPKDMSTFQKYSVGRKNITTNLTNDGAIVSTFMDTSKCVSIKLKLDVDVVYVEEHNGVHKKIET